MVKNLYFLSSKNENLEGEIKNVSDSYIGTIIFLLDPKKLVIECRESLKENKICFIERIPGAIKTQSDMSLSIIKLNASDYDDLEKVKDNIYSTRLPIKPVDKIYIESLYDELLKLQQDDRISIYEYPNKPLNFYNDEYYFIDGLISKLTSLKYKHKKLKLILMLYPNLINHVNNYIINNNLGRTFSQKDLLNMYSNYIKKCKEKNELDSYTRLIFDQYYRYFSCDENLIDGYNYRYYLNN